jgi:F-type H+-transporting ATPase subunit a
MAGPLEQFEVHAIVPLHIGHWDVSFTNASLWMCLVTAGVTLFTTLGMSKAALVPGRMQTIVEMSYMFVADTIRSVAGTAGLKFFPFVFTLFTFILFANVFGLIPGSFTVTSHIIVTFALAMVVILTVVVVGIWKHGLRFFSLFVPDVPWVMLILLVPIEIISFLTRPVSLSVRLFANMLAGHTMLKVFGGFVVSLGAAGGVFSALSIAPVLAIIAVSALELLVAALQAYVFAILTCIYLNDALHLHDH